MGFLSRLVGKKDHRTLEELLAAGREHANKGEFIPARQCYDGAVKLNPRSAEAYRSRANFLLDEYDKYYKPELSRRALKDAKKAVGLEQTADNYYIRGRAYAANHSDYRAEEDFTRAITMNTNHVQALYHRAKLRLQSGHLLSDSPALAGYALREAESDLNKAIEITKWSEAYSVRGQIRYEKARSEFKLHRFEKFPELSVTGLARSLFVLKHQEELRSVDWDSLKKLITGLSEAKQDCETALRLKSDNKDAQECLKTITHELGEIQKYTASSPHYVRNAEHS